MLNLANKLTILRIILIPVILIFLLPISSGKMLLPISVDDSRMIAAIVFVVAALTDMLDGALARKRNIVTTLGKFLDPIADKLLVISTMVALVQLGEISAWAAVIIIAREFIVSGIRILAAKDGVVIAASRSGKVKTFTQILAILFILFNDFAFSFFTSLPVGQILLWIAVILTIYSGYDYLKANKERFIG